MCDHTANLRRKHPQQIVLGRCQMDLLACRASPCDGPGRSGFAEKGCLDRPQIQSRRYNDANHDNGRRNGPDAESAEEDLELSPEMRQPRQAKRGKSGQD
jgi:hypothetical protein